MSEVVNLLGIRTKAIVCHFENPLQIAVIKPITEEEEKNIDNLKSYNTGKEKVDRNKIFVYGEINFNKKEDCELIKKLNLLSVDYMYDQIYSNFDYESGTATKKDGTFKFYVESDPVNWLKYLHCLIGKPQRIIIYKTSKLKF